MKTKLVQHVESDWMRDWKSVRVRKSESEREWEWESVRVSFEHRHENKSCSEHSNIHTFQVPSFCLTFRHFLIIFSRGPEIHLCFLQNFADKTTDGKIRFSISFLVSFELFFQELFFGHKECFIQPYLPRAFSRWKNARRASHVYIRGWVVAAHLK